MGPAFLFSFLFAAGGALLHCTGDNPDIEPVPDGSVADVTVAEGGAADDATPDAGAPRCNRTAPFGPPRIVPVTTAVGMPRGGKLSPDELVFYFSGFSGSGFVSIFESRRNSTQDDFQTRDAITALNDPSASDERPSLTADLNAVVFDSNRDAGTGPGPRLFYAVRPPGGQFGAPVLVPGVNASMERDAFVLNGGRVLYWTSERELMPARVFRAAGVDPFAYGTVAAVGGVNFGAPTDFNGAPVLTPDERVIYFSHGPADVNGNHEIYRATRDDPQQTFSTPQLVTELAHPAYDAPTWIAPDECVIYFYSTRDRDGGAGVFDAGASVGSTIWTASRPPP